MRADEDFWDDILGHLRQGVLVPVVGPELVWETLSGTQIVRYELGADGGGFLDDFHGSLVVFRPRAGDTALVIECEPCLPLADLRRLGRERLNVRVQ